MRTYIMVLLLCCLPSCARAESIWNAVRSNS